MKSKSRPTEVLTHILESFPRLAEVNRKEDYTYSSENIEWNGVEYLRFTEYGPCEKSVRFFSLFAVLSNHILSFLSSSLFSVFSLAYH
jgi:hypothetical protein